jgi:protein TonB
MRLTLSVLAAIGLHGALFGVAAALLSRPTVKEAAAATVDVEIVAPRPDPVADSAASAPPPPAPKSIPPKPRAARRLRTVALVDSSTPVSALAERSADADAPAVSAAPPAPAPAPAPIPVARAAPAAQSAGALVSAKPRYRTNPKPDYPLPSLRRREEGVVLLNVLVQTNGTPAAITLNRSCGHPLLDRAALEAVRRWTFEPARAAGSPVSSLVVIPVRFSLSEQP